MNTFLCIFVLIFSVLAKANNFEARFTLENYKEGIRLVEFKTEKYEVAFKTIEAHADELVFKVYFTNHNKKPITVDSSIFKIAS